MKKLVQGTVVGLVAALAAVALWLFGALERLEYVTWTPRVRWFAARAEPAATVKIILIDQNSLDWGQRENGWPWPWPREVYGPILDFCRRSGAKAVAFDMLYTEPSILGVGDDEAFGAAIRRAPPFVGAVVVGRESGLTTNWPAWAPEPPVAIEGFDRRPGPAGGRRRGGLRALFPIPQVATNAAMLANVMDLPDRDSVFRRATMYRAFDGRILPSLGLAAYLASFPPGERPAVRLEGGWLRVGEGRIPVDRRGRAILAFRGPRGWHESYSAAAVIQSELRLQAGEEPTIKDPDVFKGAYVLLGPSAPALMDLKATPLSRVSPGVELHATALDNILASQFLRDAPEGLVLFAVVALSLLAGVLVALSRNAWQSVAVFAVLLPVPLLAGYAAYATGVWLPVVVQEVGVAVALVGGVVVNYATEGRQKAFIRKAFNQYVGPEVMDQLMRDPARLRLGGEKRELTLFFSDLEKFSSFSERLDPPTLTALLNDYLSDMGEIIKEEGGFLDKYIGDAIVAFWGAPMPQADHAARACRAALRCQRKLAERRADFEQRTGAVLKMRVGINTGEVTVGNMGSRDRFNYTILGDAANLASRLEGANKAFGTYLMVSEATWSKAGGAFLGRELGRLRVVGRQAPVRVYEVTGLAGEAAPAWQADFEAGLRLCGEGKWAEALARFEKIADDAVSRAYADRCRKLLSDPIAAWDGVWSLTEK